MSRTCTQSMRIIVGFERRVAKYKKAGAHRI
jgi:hypothetical protein